jgi:hypothetical protein
MNSHARETPSTPEAASAAPVQTDVLAAIAFQRARVLSPVLFFAMLTWAIVIEFTEQPTFTMTIVNLATNLVVGVVAFLSRRSIAPKWGHALCSLMWCSPVISIERPRQTGREAAGGSRAPQLFGMTQIDHRLGLQPAQAS